MTTTVTPKVQVEAQIATARPFDAARLKEATRSTPGRLRMLSLIIVVLAVIAGLVTGFVVDQRRTAVDKIRTESEPLIVAARNIQTQLAEADAAASNAFLAGGIENAEQRERYEAALDRASDEAAMAARLIGNNSELQEPVAQMNEAIAEYSGLVETARVYNRQGFPVGAAYLNQGSQLLSEQVYPLTDDVANNSATRYRSDYNGLMGIGLIPVGIAILLVGGLLLVLIYTQLFLLRRFKRTLNVPLGLATAVTVIWLAWLGIGLVRQGTNLQTARADGYDGVRDYVDARGLGFRAKGAESRYLIALGSGDPNEFEEIADRLYIVDGDGLLDRLSDAADGNEQVIADEVVNEWIDYRTVHDEILAAESVDRAAAEELALSDANVEFDEFVTATAEGLTVNQAQFDTAMGKAVSSVRFLAYGSILLALIAAALSGLGLQQRINEYR